MYGSKEIKIALRKYIASTGNKTIDEQSVIDILDKGKDRDFYASSKVIKEIRQQYGVGQSIPEWLRMLTFRLIYDYLSIEYEKRLHMILRKWSVDRKLARKIVYIKCRHKYHC